MKKEKLKLKAIVLSLALAAMLPATTVSAQGVFGDMLDNYYAEKETHSSYGGSMLQKNSGDEGSYIGVISNADFGEPEAPLGTGIAILVGAGLGYVALKKKEEKQ